MEVKCYDLRAKDDVALGESFKITRQRLPGEIMPKPTRLPGKGTGKGEGNKQGKDSTIEATPETLNIVDAFGGQVAIKEHRKKLEAATPSGLQDRTKRERAADKDLRDFLRRGSICSNERYADASVR